MLQNHCLHLMLNKKNLNGMASLVPLNDYIQRCASTSRVLNSSMNRTRALTPEVWMLNLTLRVSYWQFPIILWAGTSRNSGCDPQVALLNSLVLYLLYLYFQPKSWAPKMLRCEQISTLSTAQNNSKRPNSFLQGLFLLKAVLCDNLHHLKINPICVR